MYSSQKTSDGKRRPIRQGDPVDAEELSRRLTAYLSQQNSKTSKSGESRIRKTFASRGRRSKEKCERKSPNDPLQLEESTPTTATRENQKVMHKFSRPLLKYQKHLENRFFDSKLNINNRKSLDYRQRHHSHPTSHLRGNQYSWGEQNSSKGQSQVFDVPIDSSRQRIFHIHTGQGRKSGRRWKSDQTSSESQVITSEDSRNSTEPPRPGTNNSVWISIDEDPGRSRDTSTHQGKKWDWIFMPHNKKMAREPCSDKTSIESPELSLSPRSRSKLRSSIVALFRRNTNT